MTNNIQDNTILKVHKLKKYFPIKKGFLGRSIDFLKAVDGINLDLKKGETLGVVGESGCGKSTLARLIVRLLEPTDGEILFKGENILDKSIQQFRLLRKDIQMVFQDPYASLNPRMSVGKFITEPLIIQKTANGCIRREAVENLLELVGLSKSHMERYPHMFSGGQRQRIMIARAIVLNPELLILDEPVSALDLSIQSQIINLLEDLQEKYLLTYMFIAHNLSVIRHISDRVVVMYLGKIVETAEVDELFKNPAHPYTEALLSAIPHINPDATERRIILKGDVPSPINIPSGCRFHTRCMKSIEICKLVEPELFKVNESHFAACHLINQN